MCFDQEFKQTWPEEELLGFFFDACVWRAAASLEAAAWSTVKGEERSKGTNRKTLPSGFSSHLVLSTLDFIYTLWMKGCELEIYIREEGEAAGTCAFSISVGILGCHLLGRRQSLFFFDLSSKNVLISRQVTQKALWKLGPCLGCLSPDPAFRIKCDG